ncbi:hypothetical protein RHGRI_008673 [Rhododendron griersonianum]|uniref:Wall-associated receptor kinase galacturonan-binding domain-containing protein n=1 Tax=Rhododendron griersonianum TaxID=479676 RepID=A0AAV6L2V3_9ERIC|nr:hypothetical protein RHGRI_008673 [Rhododendron griersonianum]
MALAPAGIKPPLLLLLVIQFSVTCSYSNQNQQFINSCGDIHNISFPFQLQGDPSNTCNDKNYTLSCDENNRTVFHLSSGKYYVQSINYTDHYFPIRLVDVGVQTNDICSSFPLSSVSINGILNDAVVVQVDAQATSSVMFLSCENPVQSPIYINRTGGCNNTGETRFGNGYYSYVVAEDVSIGEVADSCTVEALYLSSSPLIRDRGSKLSLSDFNRELGYGFDVLFKEFSCTECRKRASCFGISLNVTAVCADYCSVGQISKLKPTMSPEARVEHELESSSPPLLDPSAFSTEEFQVLESST